MKRVTAIFLTMMFFTVCLFSRSWVNISNNSDSPMEIRLGFGGLGLTIEPFTSMEFTYGSEVVIITPYGVALEYHHNGDFTLELCECGYFVNDEYRSYWNESDE